MSGVAGLRFSRQDPRRSRREHPGCQKWTPKFRPRLKLDFSASARREKEQSHEKKTQKVQWGLQGQIEIGSTDGNQNHRTKRAGEPGASGVGHAEEGDYSGTVD